MKKNILWLWSNICSSFAMVSLLSFLTAPMILPKIIPFFKGTGVSFAGNVFMIIGFVIVFLGVAACWVAYCLGNEKLFFISNIVCDVGALLSLGFVLMFVPGIVLGWLGYVKIKKESKKTASL